MGGPEVPKGLPRVGEGRAGKERGAESAESPSEAGLRIKGTAGSGRFVKWQYLHKGEKQVGCPSSRDCRPRGKQKRGGQEPESEAGGSGSGIARDPCPARWARCTGQAGPPGGEQAEGLRRSRRCRLLVHEMHRDGLKPPPCACNLRHSCGNRLQGAPQRPELASKRHASWRNLRDGKRGPSCPPGAGSWKKSPESGAVHLRVTLEDCLWG